MLTLLVVGVILLVVLFRYRPAGGELERNERLFLLASPFPALLALILPGAIALMAPRLESQRTWALRLNWAGCGLSALLTLIGILLLVRRSARQAAGDNRLLAGVLVAALPVLLIGLVALLYALR